MTRRVSRCSQHGGAADGGGQRAGRRVHEQAGPEDHEPAGVRAVRAGLDDRVAGPRRDGRVRGPAADRPVHRAAGPAVGRVHSRGDGTPLPGRRPGHDIVLGVRRHTGRARHGHVPRLAAGVRPLLDRAVCRLRAHMVHARVARLAPEPGPGRPGRPGRAPIDRRRQRRPVAAARARSNVCRRHPAAAAVGPPVFRASVVRPAAGRAVRVLFRPAVLRRQRRRLLFGDDASESRPGHQRVPLHNGAGRDQAGRVRAGVRADQAVRPPTARRRLGRGHDRVPAVPGRGRRRHRPADRRRRARGARLHGGQPDARPVHRLVHGVRQHRSGAVTVDHGGRGKRRAAFRTSR